MRKIYKRILTGFGILAGILVLFALGYFIIAMSLTKSMTTTETGEVIKNVFSIQDSYVNFYLIKDGDNFIAIDAGNTQANVKAELKKLNIDPGKITAVLLTHSDNDHAAGLSLFKKADIYLPEQEEQMINGDKPRFFIFRNKIDAAKYSLIGDQQILTIGHLKIQGYHTPGHTPGSMCYLLNDSLLFTGDALRLNQGRIEKFYTFFNMDTETAVQSIGKIIRIGGVRYMFTAHNGFTGNFEEAIKDWTLNEAVN